MDSIFVRKSFTDSKGLDKEFQVVSRGFGCIPRGFMGVASRLRGFQGFPKTFQGNVGILWSLKRVWGFSEVFLGGF